MDFLIDKENLDLGVRNTSIALIMGVKIPSDCPPRLSEMREAALRKALSYTQAEIKHSAILDGYHRIYETLGYKPGSIEPAAQALIELTAKRGRLPQINAAVDAYNTVVIERLVGIGAHDLDKVRLPISFTRSTGAEKFKPLGSKKYITVPKGDFLYKDANDLVLARLAADDCDDAKLSFATENILIVIEGNPSTPAEYTRATAEEACRRIVEFCGGSYLVSAPQVTPYQERLAHA